MKLWYHANMKGSKPVQISLDRELLERIDRDAEVRRRGRSAFIRAAVEHYLAFKERREVEAQLFRAYGGQAESMLSEIAELMDHQSWPNE
jgi:metal-responsive CopG/Arc/MetJ family transcriptional regulator